ncbi:hypothetical protein CYMTET_48647 [Cymbomonas tetramitiformis]|uniref:Reverse transcriptase domain-containing protein n=1 Tax=Cymbomonas tetramitiformis TaxID=36881 RepID=A0AAE0BRT2_9CHLO|nr:hypothetical protein CYMTET_48647 [Cymbomonas tetramitiformis]
MLVPPYARICDILPWLTGARLVAHLKPGGGVRPIACGEVLRRLAGKVVCRQMRMRFAAHFGAPPGDGAASSAAQVGVGVQGGAEVCMHTVQALLGAMPSWCALHLDCKNAFNSVHRRAIHRAVYEDFPEFLGITESCFRHDSRLGWRGPDGEFSPSGVCEDFRDVVDAAGDSIPGADVALEGIKVLEIPVGLDPWVVAQCHEIAVKAGEILPKLARLNDPHAQLLLLSPYPIGEAAVALNQLPTRWGGLGLMTSAQRLAPAEWLGSWAHVWKRMVVMFPVVRGLLPHLGAPEGTDAGGHPLVAGLFSAMEDVRGARLRVLAVEAGEHVMPEGLQIPEEASRWESFCDTRPASQKELTIYQHGSDWLSLFDAANSAGRARLLSLSRDGATWHLNALPMEGGFCLKPIASVISLCLQLDITLPLVREMSAVGTGRPDVTVLNYDGRGRHVIIDVVIGFPCAPSFERRAAQSPLHTAETEHRREGKEAPGGVR